MNRIYARGMIGQCWYNFTEALAYSLMYRPTPDELIYTKNLKYGEDKMQYIYTYSNKKLLNKKKPLFIYIHGGGWISGITEMRNAYISEWAKKGFFTASISYTYAPQKMFPHQLKEIFTAIDYILDNADKNNVDKDNIVLAGESAGGYYVAYVASCINDTTVLDKLGINFRHKDSFKIKSIISHCGCYDLKRLTNPEKRQSRFPDMKMMISSFLGMNLDEIRVLLDSDNGYLYSPQINSQFPPSFITWGDKDLLRYEAYDFAESLRQNNVKYKLFKSDGIIGMHAWSIVTLFNKSKKCLDETFDFVLPYLDNYFIKNADGEWLFNNYN